MKGITCSRCFWIRTIALTVLVSLLIVEALRADTAPPGTLDVALNQRKQSFTEKAPPEISMLYEQGIVDVANSGVLETALKVGDPAPDFALPHATGETVTLSELLEQGPVVLTWYRGGWCPYCNITLHYLQQKLPEFKAAGATLVAISPEQPDKSLSTQEKNELEFYVLSDMGNQVAGDYGIKYKLPPEIIASFDGRLDIPGYNGDDSWELPLSATYIVDTDGTIAWAYVNPDYRERAEPDDIVKALRELK